MRPPGVGGQPLAELGVLRPDGHDRARRVGSAWSWPPAAAPVRADRGRPRPAQPETEFQVGLREFSMLLEVAGVLTGAIFIVNVVLHRPLIDACCSRWRSPSGSRRSCSAVVIDEPRRRLARSPKQGAGQAAGLHRGPRRRRVLFTDKTGTLTEAAISFMRRSADGTPTTALLVLGLLATRPWWRRRGRRRQPLDLPCGTPRLPLGRHRRSALRPVARCRSTTSASWCRSGRATDGNRLITKGAPETVLARAATVPERRPHALDAQFAARAPGRGGRSRDATALRRSPPTTSATSACRASSFSSTRPKRMPRFAGPAGRLGHHGEDRHR